MANFKSFTPFFSIDFSLYPIVGFQSDFQFADNVNRVIEGKTYQDIAAYQFDLEGSESVYFGGAGFKFDALDNPTAGTVTGIAAFGGAIGNLDSPLFTLDGISISAVALAKVVSTPTGLDDAKLLADVLGGNDKITLSDSYDYMSGFAGNDLIYGNGGDDTLYGGTGNDKILGGAGADQLEGQEGDDVLIGGAGIDTASYLTAKAGVTVNLSLTTKQNTVGAGMDTLSGFERLYGSNYADTLTGTRGNNEIIGLGGADVIDGGAGNDLINGDQGKDTLTGGIGADRFNFVFTPLAKDADLITDFSHAERDKIVLDPLAYSGLSDARGHAITSAELYAAAGATSAHDSTDRIIYNTTTGVLYYDADGIGGAAAVQIATLGTGTHPALVAGDIMLSI